MVITSSTGNQHFTQTGSKLRRSRRLSSTRGLVPRNIKNTSNDRTKPDLNQKLGLCPIVSKNVNDEEKIKQNHMNWDLNERISLSSDSSPGIDVHPDVERGIEFSRFCRKTDDETKCKTNDIKPRIKSTTKEDLELMNVSGFPDGSHNLIKRDFKYMIDPTIVKKSNQSRAFDDVQLPKNEKTKEVITTAQRRWMAAKEKVDRTNESISKRLELIHELNQKIFSNCEKFQRKSKTKEGKNDLDVSLKRNKVLTDHLKNAEMYSKEKSNFQELYERNGLFKQKVDINKFTFSKDYCERLLSTQKGFDPKRDDNFIKTHSKSESGDNFSLAAKPEFIEHRREMEEKNNFDKSKSKSMSERVIENRSDVSRSVFYVQNDYGDSQVKEEVVRSNDQLESSRLYPESDINFRKSNSYQIKVNTPDGSVDRGRLKKVNAEDKENNGNDDNDNYSMQKINKIKKNDYNPESNSKESKDTINFTKISSQEKILEDEILKNLNDTIGSFDTEKNNDTLGSDSVGKSESFSTDSIQSLSPITSSQSAANTTLHETFNSSWDSGVSVEVGSGSGWVRVHTGIESSLVYLTLETTCKDVCRDMLLGDELSLFIQVSNKF